MWYPEEDDPDFEEFFGQQEYNQEWDYYFGNIQNQALKCSLSDFKMKMDNYTKNYLKSLREALTSSEDYSNNFKEINMNKLKLNLLTDSLPITAYGFENWTMFEENLTLMVIILKI